MMRGGATVAALAVAAVILHVLMQPSGRAAGTLGTGVLAAIGRISYGVYLWHFPIFWVTGALRADEGTVDLPRALLASAVSFAVAALCYTTVERPALRLKARLAPP
jgi:peptidoglycan/LPS O-acetylase OafA/YrhL